MKAIVLVAGVGSRFAPHTFSTPKALMEVAGRELITFIVDEVKKLKPEEIIFVVGHMKERMEKFLREYLSEENISFVEQKERKGDGDAIRIALESLKERGESDSDVFIIFNDTIVDFNLKKAIEKEKENDAIVFTKRVEDPEHYGVVYVDGDLVYDVVEKPEEPESDLAIIGAYWFKSYYLLLEKINYIIENELGSKGEYRLADAIRELVKDDLRDLKVKAVEVANWFDCGRPDILLKTNQYLLGRRGSSGPKIRGDSIIIGPSYVARNAKVEGSVIGPHVSLSKGVVVRNSVVVNSIISQGAVIENMHIKDSLIGPRAVLRGRFKKLNFGEKNSVDF